MRYFMIAAAALLLDAAFGDPAWIPHPVVMMGRWILYFERRVRPLFPAVKWGEITGGALLAASTVGGTCLITVGALGILERIHPCLWWILSIFWGWQCLAMKGLAAEGKRIRKTLEDGTIEEARAAVGRIVGRDTGFLDREGVIRAAVESIAENFSDGAAAPLFFMLLFGAPGAMAYKAINTMDSMTGYRNEKYLYFGRVPARLDDAANFIPARLSAFALMASALLCGANASLAWKIWKRDRKKHPSPNAGRPESVMAGALEIRLGGPSSYFGVIHEKPWIGDGIRSPQSSDIGRAVTLMQTAAVLFLTAFAPAALIL